MKGKKIDLNEIKNSPYTTAVALFLVIALVIAATGYIIFSIIDTKKEIVAVRNSFQENLKQIAVLEELRSKSEKAEAQLEVYKGILPDGLGDVYILQENVIETCRNFGLDVSTIEVTQLPAQTQETIFIFNVSGKYSDIHSYLSHITSLEQIHRFDAIALRRVDDGSYTATISLAILSQNGAEGVLAAAVDAGV